jgi:hypothetical protein
MTLGRSSILKFPSPIGKLADETCEKKFNDKNEINKKSKIRFMKMKLISL